MNSAGNIAGIIPKNFLIALVRNHHWLDESRLSADQKLKLPRMYRKLSNSDELDDSVLDEPIIRRNTRGRATITQNDWYMKEFSRETMQGYKLQKLQMPASIDNNNMEELKRSIKKHLLEDSKRYLTESYIARQRMFVPSSAPDAKVDEDETDEYQRADESLRASKKLPQRSFAVERPTQERLLVTDDVTKTGLPVSSEEHDLVYEVSQHPTVNDDSVSDATVVRKVEDRKKVLGQFTMLQD